MFVGCELSPKDIELGNDAHNFSDLAHLGLDIESADLGRALGGVQYASEHAEGRRLASAVVAEE